MLLFVFRDHPKTIRQRFRSVFVISLLAPLYVWLWADGTSDHNVSISLKKKNNKHCLVKLPEMDSCLERKENAVVLIS